MHEKQAGRVGEAVPSRRAPHALDAAVALAAHRQPLVGHGAAASRGVLYVGPVFDRFSCQLLYLGYGTVLS